MKQQRTLTYCIPKEAGIDSQDNNVAKRIGRLITELDSWTWAIVDDGPDTILSDIRAFRMQLQSKLEAEGWTMTYGGGSGSMKVRPPGHPRPFKKVQL